MSLKEDTAISISDRTPGMLSGSPPAAPSASESAPPRVANALLTHRLVFGKAGAAPRAAEHDEAEDTTEAIVVVAPASAKAPITFMRRLLPCRVPGMAVELSVKTLQQKMARGVGVGGGDRFSVHV